MTKMTSLKALWFFGLVLFGILFQSFDTKAQKSISGKVLDADDGSSLIGATVLLKSNPKNFTITDFEGKFNLVVNSDKDILIVSYIGYQKEEFALGSSSTININLKPATNNLKEAVVVGYGTQLKRDLTGSVGHVSADDIRDVSNNTFQNSIQGMVAGVSVTGTSGALGTPSFVRIRGIGSLTSIGDPLYIIDVFTWPINPISEMGSFGAP